MLRRCAIVLSLSLFLIGGCEPPDVEPGSTEPGQVEATAVMQGELQNYPNHCPTGLLYDTSKTVGGVQVTTGFAIGGVGVEKAAMAWGQGGFSDRRVYGAFVDYQVDHVDPLAQTFEVGESGKNSTEPAISVNAGQTGNRVAIAWRQYNSSTGYDIMGRTYMYTDGNTALTQIQGPTLIPANNAGAQETPQVQYLWDGTSIVFTWHDSGALKYRMCDVSLTCSGSDPDLRSYTSGSASAPRLDAFRDNRGFVAVWRSNRLTNTSDTVSDYNIYYRRFANDGTPIDIDDELVSNDNGTDDHWPDVAVLDEDAFAVVWQQGYSPVTNTIYYKIYGFDGSVIKSTTQLAGNSTTLHAPRAAAFRDGLGFAVAWGDRGTPDRFDLVHLTPAGVVVDPPGIVSTESVGYSTDFHELDAMQCNSFVHGYARQLPDSSWDVRAWYPKLW